MILDNGSKILVAHRRMYESDQDRFFVGVVEGYENGIVKASGYTFGRSLTKNEFVKKRDLRTKILSVSSGTLIVYEMLRELDIEAAQIKIDGRRVFLVAGEVRMDLTDHDVRSLESLR